MTQQIESLLPDPGLARNGPDGMSCLHACIQMLQRTAVGARVYGFGEIDKILRRRPGIYSWEYAILLDLARNGYAVELHGAFDIRSFLAAPEGYLIEFFGEEAGRDQIENSDLDQVVEDARAFIGNDLVHCRLEPPGRSDIEDSIRRGFYVVASVNQKILQADPGIVSHLILIYGFSERGVRCHNPGPPATAATELSWELFEKAWNRPAQQNREMFAVRPPQGI